MNDEVDFRHSEPAVAGQTAGEIMRQARVAAGIHIASLASSIKVPVRKLELLEADRYEELPDPAFTRALAQTVCRALKIDASPVLALLPRAKSQAVLSEMGGGARAPFREGMQASRPTSASSLLRPLTLATLVLLAGAAALLLYPGAADWVSRLAAGEDTAAEAARSEPPAVSPPLSQAPMVPSEPVAAVAPGEVPGPQGAPAAEQAAGSGETGASAGVPSTSASPGASGAAPQKAAVSGSAGAGAGAGAGASTVGASTADASTAGAAGTAVPPSGAGAGVGPAGAAGNPGTALPPPTTPVDNGMPAEYARYAVVVLASETSWVEVRDASGKALLSRRLEPGQPAGINGQYPMSVIVGNAHATQLWSKGHAVDLKAAARENVARIELR